jgi:hypothetical protein
MRGKEILCVHLHLKMQLRRLIWLHQINSSKRRKKEVKLNFDIKKRVDT